MIEHSTYKSSNINFFWTKMYYTIYVHSTRFIKTIQIIGYTGILCCGVPRM